MHSINICFWYSFNICGVILLLIFFVSCTNWFVAYFYEKGVFFLNFYRVVLIPSHSNLSCFHEVLKNELLAFWDFLAVDLLFPLSLLFLYWLIPNPLSSLDRLYSGRLASFMNSLGSNSSSPFHLISVGYVFYSLRFIRDSIAFFCFSPHKWQVLWALVAYSHLLVFWAFWRYLVT